MIRWRKDDERLDAGLLSDVLTAFIESDTILAINLFLASFWPSLPREYGRHSSVVKIRQFLSKKEGCRKPVLGV